MLAVVLLVSNRGVDASVSVTAALRDGHRTATVETVDRSGRTCVSLNGLVEQLGGACSILPTRVQVDLAGATAWMKLNDTSVNASLGNFSLRYPIEAGGREVWMALEDIGPFFQGAFRIPVKSEAASEAVSPLQPIPPGDAERLTRFEPIEPSEALESTPVLAEQSPIGVIIVDPGHGGSDVGCVGPNGLKEKDLTLTVSRKLQEALSTTTRASVLLTRTEDIETSLAARAAFTEKNRGGLFVSIHGGASFSRQAHGVEVFCPSADAYQMRESGVSGPPTQRPPFAQVRQYAAESLALGQAVAATLAQAGSREGRGVHTVPCRVMRDLLMPGALIEIGYLTNPSEEALLQTDSYQTSLAKAIAEGIANYLASSKPGASRRDGN